MGKTGKTFVSDRLSGLSPDQANHSKGVVFSRARCLSVVPEGVMFTDYVKRIKNDRCFHEEDYISLW